MDENRAQESATIGQAESCDGNRDDMEGCAARCYLYSLLARIFAEEPDGNVMSEMAGSMLQASVDIVTTEARTADPDAATLLRRSLESLRAFRATVTPEAFVGLFCGPSPLQAPPWPSVYLDGSNGLFTKRTLEARSFYARAGFVVNGGRCVSDDYLATELEFAAALCREEVLAAERDDVVARDRAHGLRMEFLSRCLIPWIGRFADRMTEVAGKSGYAAAARAASALAKCDVGVGRRGVHA